MTVTLCITWMTFYLDILMQIILKIADKDYKSIT